ncbi:GNAT family N-acetyltransferase [Plantibacter sp. YIM 135249]|uniref:GNAT family N-acetyltransferase n=1 Tax=Plantibacter sp. YIM 135249 TaxID=3423918 RepID=UPI003D34D78E
MAAIRNDVQMDSTSLADIAVAHRSATSPESLAQLASVITLAKKHRQTLGFLPDAAFSAAAESGNLVVAHASDVLVGYALYRITRSTIKLTHVCVDHSARGRQLGQALIWQVVSAHPHSTGVMESAGLSPLSEAAGRSAKGLP